MLDIFVPGVPVPKGSAKAFFNKKLGRSMVVQTNADKQRPWASMISVMAQQAGCRPTPDPVECSLVFHMPRPKGHFNAKGVLKESSPCWPNKKPDIDKLERCVLDALTGIAWVDDAQVCMVKKVKIYALFGPGVQIVVKPITEGPCPTPK